MRKRGLLLARDPLPSPNDLSVLLFHLEENVANNYLRYYEASIREGDRAGQDLAAAELLKFFRILPEAYFRESGTPEYYIRVIQFILEKEKDLAGANDEVFYQLALCHLVLGDSLRAFHYISKISSEDVHPDVAFVFGFTCFALNRFENALKYLAISSDSDDDLVKFDSIMARAVIFSKQKNYNESLSEWNRLLGVHHPVFTDRDVLFNIATVHFFAKNYSEYTRIMNDLECYNIIHHRLYLEAVREDWEAAIRYGAMLRISHPPFDVVLLSAYLRYRQRSYVDAYFVLNKVYKHQDEKNPAVWFLLAIIMYRAGPHHLVDAVTLLNNANMLKSGDPWIEKCLGAVLELSKRFDDAEIVYKRMIEGQRLVGYANYRLSQVTAFRQRLGDVYKQPEIEEIPITAIIDSPGDRKLTSFQTGPLLASKRLMSFLGDVEPEISYVHRNMSIFEPEPEMKPDAAAGLEIVRSVDLFPQPNRK